MLIIVLLLLYFRKKIDFYKKKYSDYKPTLTKVVFTFFLINNIFHKVNYVNISVEMWKVANTPTPDNCQIVNSRNLWYDKMGFFTNNDNSLFPDFSCPDISADCINNTRLNKYTTFTEYYHLLLIGWPKVLYPDKVEGNLKEFQNICANFINVRGVKECGLLDNNAHMVITYLYIFLYTIIYINIIS